MSIELPPHAPKPGFYRSYKHDPKGPPLNNTFAVSVGCNSNGEFYVVYLPLDKTMPTYNQGLFDVKTLADFTKPQEDGSPRYTRITDFAVIVQLEAQFTAMYGLLELFGAAD